MQDNRVYQTFEEYQMAAYGGLVEAIVNFDLLDRKKLAECLSEGIAQILEEFERGYIFLDDETVAVFDNRISIPINKGEFDFMLKEQKYGELCYDTLRLRLVGEVLLTARKALKKRFPEAY